MSPPITFLHFTDLHISNPDKPEPHAFQDTAETLTRVLEIARTIEPRPSFVVVSGDIANHADPAAYAELKRLWGDFPIPALFALGNHDNRAGFYEVFLDRHDHQGAPYAHSRVIDGVHVVCLDSSTPGQIHGTIEPEQFAWLEEVLDAHPGLPTVIAIHHPPAVGAAEHEEHAFETTAWADSQRLASMLRAHNVVGILAGHVHYDRVSVWNGIPVVITNGHHSSTDILNRDGMRAVAGAGFALCTLRPTGLTVSFVPLPSDRRELYRIPGERIRQLMSGRTAEEAVAEMFPVAAE